MAATTISGYGTELAAAQAPLYAHIQPNQLHGRVRIMQFTYTFASDASGTSIAAGVLPKGARIISGDYNVSATMGSATIAFGLAGKDASGYIDSASTVSDSTALLLAAATNTTTAIVQLAATAALSRYYETQKELYVTFTVGTASAATQVLKGHLLYVVD